MQDEISTTANQELAEIKRRDHALRQELFSRALRDVPTSCLESLAGELHQRIEHLESTCSSRREEAPTLDESSTHSAIPTPHSALEEPKGSEVLVESCASFTAEWGRKFCAFSRHRTKS